RYFDSQSCKRLFFISFIHFFNKNSLVLLGRGHFFNKNHLAPNRLESPNAHIQGPCGAPMIGRTRERATLLLFRFVPQGQNRIAQHDPRVSCLFFESQIEGCGTRKVKPFRKSESKYVPYLNHCWKPTL